MRLNREVGIGDLLRIFGIKKVNEKFYESLKSSETPRTKSKYKEIRATKKENGSMTNRKVVKIACSSYVVDLNMMNFN